MTTVVYLNWKNWKYYFLYGLHSLPLQHCYCYSIFYFCWSEGDIVTKLVTLRIYVCMYDLRIILIILFMIKIKYLYLFVSLFGQNLGIV